MNWTVIGHTGEECSFVSEHEKRFYTTILAAAIRNFLFNNWEEAWLPGKLRAREVRRIYWPCGEIPS
jgi:hypothetical protein